MHLYFFQIFLKINYFNWRTITSQYCDGFCHTSTWIGYRQTCAPRILNTLPPTSTPILSLWPVLSQSTSFECPASCLKLALVSLSLISLSLKKKRKECIFVKVNHKPASVFFSDSVSELLTSSCLLHIQFWSFHYKTSSICLLWI